MTPNLYTKTYWLNSLIIFLFFALLFIVKGNFAANAVFLLLVSMVSVPRYLKYIKRVNHAYPIWAVTVSILFIIDLALRENWDKDILNLPIFFIGTIPIYYHLSHFGFNKDALFWGLYLSAIVGGINVLVFTTNSRPYLANINPIMMGSIAVFLLVFSGYRLLATWKDLLRRPLEIIAASYALIGSFFMIIASASRGPLITFVILLGFIAIYFKLYREKLFYIGSIAIFALSTSFYLGYPEQTINKRISSAVQQLVKKNDGVIVDKSTTIRTDLYKSAIEMAKSNLILGTGFRNRHEHAEVAQKSLGLDWKYLSGFNHFHSDFFNILALFGLLGISMYFCFIYIVMERFFKITKKLNKHITTIFTCYILTFVAMGITDVSVLYTNGTALLVLPAIFFLGLINYNELLFNDRIENEI